MNNYNIVSTDVPYTSSILFDNLNKLKSIYPFIRVFPIGYSVLGTEIPCIRFGIGAKEVFYSSSIHANEWLTSTLLMKFLEEICKGYVNNSMIYENNIRELFNKVSLYIVPMINPDGVDLVTNNLDENSLGFLQAKAISNNFPDIPFPNGWKANILGIDLNLQFPAGWDEAKEIKYAQGFNQPAPRDFVGFSPVSTPESKAIYKFTLAHNFSLILTYHSQGKVIYWQYQNYAPEEGLEIANKFASVSGYSVQDVPYNSSFAGLKDWFIYKYRRPGFTIEVGSGTNPLPLSQFSEIYNDNLGILILGMVQ
jgi:g-D-glutamyl-meso-diaminopimelate peptidase